MCSSHFGESDYERDLANELLGLAVRKILKKETIPTLNLAPEDKNPRKRISAENRAAFASKRARNELVEAQKEVVAALLQEKPVQMKDAEVQVNNDGNFCCDHFSLPKDFYTKMPLCMKDMFLVQ